MFVRAKMRNGKPRYCLCTCVREGRKVRQKVLAYLGPHDSVEDAYMNGTAKQRVRLARWRDPADVVNERIEQERARQYRKERREMSRAEIRQFLPALPEQYLPLE